MLMYHLYIRLFRTFLPCLALARETLNRFSQHEPEIRCQKPQIVDGFKLNYIQSARLNGQRHMVFLLAQTCGDMTIGRYRFPDDSYLQQREINEYWLSGSGKNLATGESICCVKLKSTTEALSPC